MVAQERLALMIVSGIRVDETLLGQAQTAMVQDFALKDFQHQLEALGVETAVSYEVAKRYLQVLRRDGQAWFDRDTSLWSFNAGIQNQLGQKSLLLHPQSKEFGQSNGSTLVSRLYQILIILTCLTSIGSLVSINASFAWELAEKPAFKTSLVAALVACDLLRPLFSRKRLRIPGTWGLVPGILRNPRCFEFGSLVNFVQYECLIGNDAAGSGKRTNKL